MRTEFNGRDIIYLLSCESTNSYAASLLKKVKPNEGTVVISNEQTHGKGMKGNVWKSNAGDNLTFSKIFFPGFLSLQKIFFLYQISALACYDCLSEILQSSQFDIKIKWPNDILIGRKKIAGILIENTIHESNLQSVILGIGLNVNQVEFSEAIIATSLKLITGKETDLNSLFEKLNGLLDKYYQILKNEEFNLLNELYHQKLFGLNEVLNFDYNGNKISLMVTGINENGFLILKTESDDLLEADVKEIKWLDLTD